MSPVLNLIKGFSTGSSVGSANSMNPAVGRTPVSRRAPARSAFNPDTTPSPRPNTSKRKPAKEAPVRNTPSSFDEEFES